MEVVALIRKYELEATGGSFAEISVVWLLALQLFYLEAVTAGQLCG